MQEEAETSTYILATVHGYDRIYAEQQGQLSLPPTNYHFRGPHSRPLHSSLRMKAVVQSIQVPYS